MQGEKKIVEEVTVITKEVYTDVLKPAASEVGSTLGGVVRVMLAPLNGVVWGFDKIVEMLEEKLNEKLKNIDKTNLQSPPAFIAVPTLEALRYTSEFEDLRNLYANLLANAMDKSFVGEAHPSFVDIIKSLTPDEAILLTAFIEKDSLAYINVIEVNDRITRSFTTVVKTHTHVVSCFDLNLKFEDNLPLYFDNLVRAGILTSPDGFTLIASEYEDLENCGFILNIKEEIKARGFYPETQRKFFVLTTFGSKFINTVVRNK